MVAELVQDMESFVPLAMFSFLIATEQMSLLGVAFGLLAAYLISSGERGKIVAGQTEYWVVPSTTLLLVRKC